MDRVIDIKGFVRRLCHLLGPVSTALCSHGKHASHNTQVVVYSQDFPGRGRGTLVKSVLCLSSNHLLLECADFNDVRRRFYQVPSLQDLFKTVMQK